jgi:hypothetical protein
VVQQAPMMGVWQCALVFHIDIGASRRQEHLSSCQFMRCDPISCVSHVQTAPDTWHIANDQDVVVHGLKMFGWYKRNGHRVIVNNRGDLIVRPSFLELSLLKVVSPPFMSSTCSLMPASCRPCVL